MPVKAKKLKKVRIRKVRQVRARRQATVRKPPITNVNIHFAGGSQHAGSVYIPNAGEHQVIPMASVQPTQAFVPSSLAKPVSSSSRRQEQPSLAQEIHTPTPKVGVSSVGTQHEEPEIHTFYEETHTPISINPMLSRLVSPVRTPVTTGGGGVVPVEAKNVIDINRDAVRDASRLNIYIPTRAQRGKGAGDGLSRLLLPALQDIATNYGINSVGIGGKKRTRAELQEMIKNLRK